MSLVIEFIVYGTSFSEQNFFILFYLFMKSLQLILTDIVISYLVYFLFLLHYDIFEFFYLFVFFFGDLSEFINFMFILLMDFFHLRLRNFHHLSHL